MTDSRNRRRIPVTRNEFTAFLGGPALVQFWDNLLGLTVEEAILGLSSIERPQGGRRRK